MQRTNSFEAMHFTGSNHPSERQNGNELWFPTQTSGTYPARHVKAVHMGRFPFKPTGWEPTDSPSSRPGQAHATCFCLPLHLVRRCGSRGLRDTAPGSGLRPQA